MTSISDIWRFLSNEAYGLGLCFTMFINLLCQLGLLWLEHNMNIHMLVPRELQKSQKWSIHMTPANSGHVAYSCKGYPLGTPLMVLMSHGWDSVTSALPSKVTICEITRCLTIMAIWLFIVQAIEWRISSCNHFCRDFHHSSPFFNLPLLLLKWNAMGVTSVYLFNTKSCKQNNQPGWLSG